MPSPTDVAARAEALGLRPHPEGGLYREVYRSPIRVQRPDGAWRAAGTTIDYLLTRADFSAFHRVRGADEIWHLQEGGDLELHLLDPAGGTCTRHVLSESPARGGRVTVVPAGVWQAARPLGPAPYALCACTVTPGFDFEDFDLASRETLEAEFPTAHPLIRSLTR